MSLRYFDFPVLFQFSIPSKVFRPHLILGLHNLIAVQGQAASSPTTNLISSLSPYVLSIEFDAGFTLIYEYIEVRLDIIGMFSVLNNIQTTISTPVSLSPSTFHGVFIVLGIGI